MDIKILMALHRYHFTSKPFLLAIAKDPMRAYYYAAYSLKGPFKLGEPTIAKNPQLAYWYALNILKGPFPLGEPAIAADPWWAYLYAKEILHLPKDQAKQWRG